MNIVIVDDDEEDRMIFCEALCEVLKEPNCIEKNSCQDLENILNSGVQIDVIFIDGFMYPTTGIECLKKLQPLIDRSKTKIVIHSGSVSPFQHDQFSHLGVDDILEKGSSFDSVKTNLRNLLRDKYRFE